MQSSRARRSCRITCCQSNTKKWLTLDSDSIRLGTQKSAKCVLPSLQHSTERRQPDNYSVVNCPALIDGWLEFLPVPINLPNIPPVVYVVIGVDEEEAPGTEEEYTIEENLYKHRWLLNRSTQVTHIKQFIKHTALPLSITLNSSYAKLFVSTPIRIEVTGLVLAFDH